VRTAPIRVVGGRVHGVKHAFVTRASNVGKGGTVVNSARGQDRQAINQETEARRLDDLPAAQGATFFLSTANRTAGAHAWLASITGAPQHYTGEYDGLPRGKAWLRSYSSCVRCDQASHCQKSIMGRIAACVPKESREPCPETTTPDPDAAWWPWDICCYLRQSAEAHERAKA